MVIKYSQVNSIKNQNFTVAQVFNASADTAQDPPLTTVYRVYRCLAGTKTLKSTTAFSGLKLEGGEIVDFFSKDCTTFYVVKG